MADTTIDPVLVERVRFICRVIDNGQFSLDLKWNSVLDTLAHSIEIERDKIPGILNSAGVGFVDGEDADFLVAGVFDATVDHASEERIFTHVIEKIEQDPLFRNLLTLVSTEYDFTLALLEFLFRKQGRQLEHFKNSTLLPLITSDIFIESKSANRYVNKQVKTEEVDFDRIRELVRKDWFMDLLTILKSEVNVNQSSGFIKLIDREAHTVNAQEIISMISDGTLEMIVLHRNTVMKQKFVTEAFLKRYEAEQHEKKLRRFYYWLGIANDFALGIEFLVGSIEFLPGMPPESLFIGVILFIIGSAQLVARSLIQIAMNLHIRSSRKKKMEELPN